MRIGYCDYVLAALRVKYCDCCAMSLWHQVCPVLCIVYCVPGIRSVVYSVLDRMGMRSLGIYIYIYRVLCIRRDLQSHCTRASAFLWFQWKIPTCRCSKVFFTTVCSTTLYFMKNFQQVLWGHEVILIPQLECSWLLQWRY